MPESIDQQFWDRLREQHVAQRAAWSRDWKIALAVVLLFQLCIFTRFLTLTDQRQTLSDSIAAPRAQQAAVTAIQEAWKGLKASLDSGAKQVTQQLATLPGELRNDILLLESAIQDLRRGPAPDPAPMAQSAPGASRHAGGRFFVELSEEQLDALKHEGPGGDAMIKQLIDTRIVRPAFLRLNESKVTLLDQAFGAGSVVLLRESALHSAHLGQYRLDPGHLKPRLDTLHAELQRLQFAPPAAERWWGTFDEKTRVALRLVINSETIVSGVRAELDAPAAILQGLSKQLGDIIQENDRRQQELEQQLTELQARYAELQGVMKGYNQLFSVAALDLRVLAIYYPLLLALLFLWIAARDLSLRRRTRLLVQAYRHQGLSDELSPLYFGRDAMVAGSWPDRLGRWLLVVAWTGPLILAIWSVQRIWQSPVLRPEAPMLWYTLAGVACLITYAVLVYGILHPTSDKPVSKPDSTPGQPS